MPVTAKVYCGSNELVMKEERERDGDNVCIHVCVYVCECEGMMNSTTETTTKTCITGSRCVGESKDTNCLDD